MWDFSVSKALSLMTKTFPFLVFRAGVFFGIAAAYVLATGAGAGIGWGIGAFGDAEFRNSATFWGGGIGLATVGTALYFVREYVLYIVKAGHIAVMVEYLEGRDLPEDKTQIEFARDTVRTRFRQASILFAVDQTIKAVVVAVTGLIQGLVTLLPIPGVENATGLLRSYLRFAVGLVDEIILAHAIRVGARNPWEASRSALVLYAQNARPMLVNAAWVTAMVWVGAFVAFLLLLAPVAFIVAQVPALSPSSTVVFALLLAWALKTTLIEPFALACLLQVYFDLTAHQQPNPDWEAKLDQVSAKFKTMGEKATEWASGDAARASTDEPESFAGRPPIL